MADPKPRLRGTLELPGDKSLSHRALMLAALASGTSEVSGLNPGADVESTAACLRGLGIRLRRKGGTWTVEGTGRGGFSRPRRALDCGNSGTTLRLLAGILAACPFPSRLVGDASLSARPMSRIVRPLEVLGGRVQGRRAGRDLCPPLRIDGGRLRPGRWTQEVPSAQVKSALLLAAWTGRVGVAIEEPLRSRDHTERMLRALGAPLTRTRGTIRLEKGAELAPLSGRVPGDPSAGAFFAALAAALPGSDLRLSDVCLNPTRLGFYRVLERMGARIDRSRTRTWCGEPVGELRVRPGRLHGVTLGARAVPALVDEIPVLAVLAAGSARGRTRITGAAELRVKESDRLAGLAAGLARLGADLTETPDGLRIEGGRLHGGTVESHGDHRLAMAFRVAGVLADGAVRVRGAASARVSHPGFDRDLRRLLAGRSR